MREYSKLDYRLRSKKCFKRFCKEQGWNYHYTGFHDTRLNANKLTRFERANPSFIIDKDWNDLERALEWVEVKGCNYAGEVKIPIEEWEHHKRYGLVRAVNYAIYEAKGDDDAIIRMLNIEEIEASGVMREVEGYYVFNAKEV